MLFDKKTQVSVGKQYNVSATTVNKWVKQYREEGESGLEVRFSRPHTSPRATPPKVVESIITMRKEGNLTGDRSYRSCIEYASKNSQSPSHSGETL